MSLKPTERFSKLVSNYHQYRPTYPQEVIPYLRENIGLQANALVVDVGSGTGKLSELFLANGNRVIGVEPNEPMRLAAEELFKENPHFTSINGTAEQTTLADHSADLIVAGQAFHWFDKKSALTEFNRILKDQGWVVLAWNDREDHASLFMTAYEQFILTYSGGYQQIGHRRVENAEMAGFFQYKGYRKHLFRNNQQFAREDLLGYYLSTSYSLQPGHPRHPAALRELSQLFEAFSSNGLVTMEYQTRIFYGQLE